MFSNTLVLPDTEEKMIKILYGWSIIHMNLGYDLFRLIGHNRLSSIFRHNLSSS